MREELPLPVPQHLLRPQPDTSTKQPNPGITNVSLHNLSQLITRPRYIYPRRPDPRAFPCHGRRTPNNVSTRKTKQNGPPPRPSRARECCVRKRGGASGWAAASVSYSCLFFLVFVILGVPDLFFIFVFLPRFPCCFNMEHFGSGGRVCNI